MKINKAVLLGLLAAVSVVLGVAENFIPMPVPAVRLGLSNIPVMAAIYLSPPGYVFSLLLLKTFLVPVFSGNMIFKLSLGIPANFSAFAAMFIFFRFFGKISTPVSVGVAGAFAHMFAQILAASYFYIRGLLSTPITGVLLLIATVSGILTGFLTEKIIERPSFKRLFGERVV